MRSAGSGGSALGILTLSEIRGLLSRSGARMMAAFIGIVYALVSMLEGGMLVFAPSGQAFSPPFGMEIVWTGSSGWWNYPGLLVVERGWFLELPFFATLAMVVVSIGVGIGMAVAVLLAYQVLRSRRAGAAGPTTIGSLAGLTPAMLALVTLGACCSTTAAAYAGIGLVAQASGTSMTNLLLNNWYLGVFQIVVVWIALFAQEVLLVVYRGILGPGAADRSALPASASPPRARALVSALARGALLVGGVTWSLVMVAEWTTTSPASAGAGWWVQWILEHQLLAIVAVLAALFPGPLYRALVGARGTGYGLAFRGALLVGGLAVLTFVPPPLPAWGLDGWINEILGVLGAPSSWGAIAPTSAVSTSLYVRWAFQYLLLGGFALAVAIAPPRAFALLCDTRAWAPGRPPSGPEVGGSEGLRRTEALYGPGGGDGATIPSRVPGAASAAMISPERPLDGMGHAGQ